MAVRKAAAGKPGGNEVDDFMRTLDHPLKAELEAVRAIILGADPSIAEGIKWKAPSFRTTEYFATLNLRAAVVQVILHFGARVRDDIAKGLVIEDPAGLLEWLAKDRATVKFPDMKTIESKRDAFAEVLRLWIAHVR